MPGEKKSPEGKKFTRVEHPQVSHSEERETGEGVGTTAKVSSAEEGTTRGRKKRAHLRGDNKRRRCVHQEQGEGKRLSQESRFILTSLLELRKGPLAFFRRVTVYSFLARFRRGRTASIGRGMTIAAYNWRARRSVS